MHPQLWKSRHLWTTVTSHIQYLNDYLILYENYNFLVNDHTHRRLKRSPILKKLFRGRNGGNTNQNVYNYHQYQYNPQPGYRDQQYFGHPPLNNYYPPIQQQSSASASAGTIGSGNMQASFSSASASVGSSYVGGRLMSK